MFKIFKKEEVVKLEYTTQFTTTDGNILVTDTDTLEVGSMIKMLPDVQIPDGIYEIKNSDESTTMINVLNGSIVDMPTEEVELPEEEIVEVEVEQAEEVIVEDEPLIDTQKLIDDLTARVIALEEMIAGININNDKFEKIEKFMLEGKTDVKSLFETTEVKTDDIKTGRYEGLKAAFATARSKVK